MPKPRVVKPVQDLPDERDVRNRKILASFSESEFSGDLDAIYEKDFDLGPLGERQRVPRELISTVHFARRIAVRELRAKGWRTRAVDDMTGS